MRIALNDDEQAVLWSGLPPQWVVLYMRLRARMDFATGLVGIRPRVSWHAITEWLYVEPHSGRGNSGSPSVDQVRRMARGLVDAGLLKMRSKADARQLIFECVLADRDSHARKKPASKSPDHPARQPARPLQREKAPQPARQPTRPEAAQPARHPESGSAIHHHHVGIGNHTGSAPSGGGDDLIYPQQLTPDVRSAMRALVEPINGDGAQLLLDELQGAINAKPVRNPLGFMRTLVNRFQNGAFTAEAAHEVRAGRARQARMADEQARLDAETAERAKQMPTAEVRRRLKEITGGRQHDAT